jgi:hypothetical protein
MSLSAQVTELRETHETLKNEVSSTAARVAAMLDDLQNRLTAAGEPDPDLSADIQSVKDEVTRLQQIAAAPAPTPEPEPEPEPQPTPVEP